MTSIVENADAFEIGSSDLVVAACRRRATVSEFELHAPNVRWTVTIEVPFSMRRDNHGDHALALSDLVGESVRLIRARKADGQLEMRVGRDWIVTVESDSNYEAWQMYSSNGERLIAVPGGGIAVWRDKE